MQGPGAIRTKIVKRVDWSTTTTEGMSTKVRMKSYNSRWIRNVGVARAGVVKKRRLYKGSARSIGYKGSQLFLTENPP